MLERHSIRRLRGAGALGAGAIVVVLFIQVVVLVLLSMTTLPVSRSVNASGLRRTYTMRVLYDATVHDSPAAERDISRLLALQNNFHDLSPDENALFQGFIAHPNRADADALFTIFDNRTNGYEVNTRRSRTRFRTAALISGIVALAIVVLLYLLMIRPIEDRWEAMVKRLDERRERFTTIFTESPTAMAIYRTDGTILRGNAAALRMLGFGLESVGAHWSIHIAEPDRAAAAVAFERALSGTSAQFETHFKTASGAYVPVACSLSPIIVQGTIVGAVGIAKDLSEIRAFEAELERGRERFASMFDFHPDAIALIDAGGRIVRANAALERLSQYRTPELVGMPLEMLATAQDAIERAGLAGALNTDRSIQLDAALRTRNGTSVMVRIETVPMRVGGEFEGTYVIARDVTHERELEFRERLQRERLRSLAHLASENAGSVERQINELLAFAARSLDLDGGMVTRLRDDQIYVMYSIGIAHPVGTAVPFEASFTRHVFGTNNVLAFAEAQREEWEADPAQQRERWSAAIVTTAYADGAALGSIVFYSRRARRNSFTDADRDFVRVVASMIGASLERERREEELEAIAYADPLTRLPNRRYVVEHLQGAIARAERSGERVVVYYVDLDGFKEVNDAYGHAAGDEFLVVTANRLRAVVREGDVVARVGGDEFLVVQCLDANEETEGKLAERLIAVASEPANISGHAIRVGASIGMVIAPKDARTADEAIDRADRAMYLSKRGGKGVATLYVRELA